MPIDLFQIIENSVRKYPERTAIVGPQGYQISYRRLEEIVTSFSMRAGAAGISRGARVALRELPLTWHFCMLIALSRLGAVRVPPASAGNS